ncbi:MAG: SPOR domain-containing protein, partial [Bacteroidia bacterium]
EMALLLSVGDIRSTTLDDGTTVVYTAGTYDDVLNAVARRDEFIAEGNTKAKVGYFKSDKYTALTDDQLQRLIKEAKENGLKGNTSITGNNSGGNNGSNGNATNGGNNSGNNGNNGGNNSGNNGNANNGGNNTGNNGSNGGNNSGNNGNANNGGNNSGNNGNANNGGTNSGNNGNANNGGNNSNGSSGNSGGNSGKSGGETFAKGDIVYRVQLGAYKNKISPGVFKGSTSVIELKTEDNYYRYVTNGYKTIEQAASLRADLVVMGYTDAFVTAYRNGKRIPMSETKAHVESAEKEDLNENKAFSTIDKSLIHFKIQLGALKKPGSSNDMEERVKDLSSVDKQGTASGMIRYTTGQYNDYQSAEKARKDLEDKGFPEAFIIATFKNEIISIQEAMELMK